MLIGIGTKVILFSTVDSKRSHPPFLLDSKRKSALRSDNYYDFISDFMNVIINHAVIDSDFWPILYIKYILKYTRAYNFVP